MCVRVRVRVWGVLCVCGGVCLCVHVLCLCVVCLYVLVVFVFAFVCSVLRLCLYVLGAMCRGCCLCVV